jgi:hypothetical protein
MTRIIGNKPHRQPAAVAVKLAVAALLLVGTFAVSAHADDHHRDDRGRRDDHHDWHGGGGYYAPPPVVYGTPAYAPPPVVYGPGVGINIRIP